MTSDFLLLISHGWLVTFQDSHRTKFTFLSWLDLLGVVLAFFDFHSKNLQITTKLLTQDYRYHKLRKTFGKFFRSYSELLSKFGDISYRSYQSIWSFPLSNVKWHSVTWPYTMTTPYWSDFVPNSTFNRNLSGFHRTSATGVACRQGTLTPPDTWSRPFGTCICSTCWDQSFSELVILPDYALRISLGTFSILLFTTTHVPLLVDKLSPRVLVG